MESTLILLTTSSKETTSMPDFIDHPSGAGETTNTWSGLMSSKAL